MPQPQFSDTHMASRYEASDWCNVKSTTKSDLRANREEVDARKHNAGFGGEPIDQREQRQGLWTRLWTE